MDTEGFILVGGASSRMGRDKARLILRGRSFVEQIGEALGRVARSVRTVGAKDLNIPWTYENVPDVYSAWGALGGLHAALAASEAEWTAVVACDLPFVTGELLERLGEQAEGFDAVVPVQADGRLQPLCALYRTPTCLERAEALIREGERRPRALIEVVRTRRVAWEEVADLPGATLFFENINTPEDYSRALARFGEERV